MVHRAPVLFETLVLLSRGWTGVCFIILFMGDGEAVRSYRSRIVFEDFYANKAYHMFNYIKVTFRDSLN